MFGKAIDQVSPSFAMDPVVSVGSPKRLDKNMGHDLVQNDVPRFDWTRMSSM